MVVLEKIAKEALLVERGNRTKRFIGEMLKGRHKQFADHIDRFLWCFYKPNNMNKDS